MGAARICSSHRFAEPQTWLLDLRARHPEAEDVSPATFQRRTAAPPRPIRAEVRARLYRYQGDRFEAAPRTADVKGLVSVWIYQCPSAVDVSARVSVCGVVGMLRSQSFLFFQRSFNIHRNFNSPSFRSFFICSGFHTSQEDTLIFISYLGFRASWRKVSLGTVSPLRAELSV